MRIRTAATAALVLATALALAGCAGSNSSGSGAMPGMDHSSSSSAPAADFNGADVMFAQMMIPHHQQAVEMADMILAKPGINAGVVALAGDIKAAQKPEIDQLQGWLTKWGAGTSAGGMSHGGGMMSDADMKSLQAATGTEAARLFLTQMTAHHEGAIVMAQDEVNSGKNADAVKMAQSIVTTQTAEIAKMKALLGQL